MLSFDAPHRMTYRIVRGGLPISDHLGDVVFEPRDGGTRVTWRCQFNSRIPGLGGLFRVVITRPLPQRAAQPGGATRMSTPTAHAARVAAR